MEPYNKNFIQKIRNSFNNFNAEYIPYSYSRYNKNSSNYIGSTLSKYATISFPFDTSPEKMANIETEIIPVEEVEYITIKRKKLIKRITIKAPAKKTIVIHRKIIKLIPFKKRFYFKKKPNIIKLPPVIYKEPLGCSYRKTFSKSNSLPLYRAKMNRKKI